MIYLYLFGTCFHFIYVFMIIGKYFKSQEQQFLRGMDELEVHIIYLIDSRAHNNLFPVISFDPQKYKGYDRESKHKSSNEPVSDSD